MKLSAHCWFTATFIGTAVAGSTAGFAEKKYAPGVTDTEIKVGQTMPYSGPASAWGTIGLAELAYIKMINDRGGIAGRKITLVSLDDSFSPPKTVEQTRKLMRKKAWLSFMAPSVRETSQFPNTSMMKRCRRCLSPPHWKNTMTRSTFRGRWACCRPTSWKEKPMRIHLGRQARRQDRGALYER